MRVIKKGENPLGHNLNHARCATFARRVRLRLLPIENLRNHYLFSFFLFPASLIAAEASTAGLPLQLVNKRVPGWAPNGGDPVVRSSSCAHNKIA